MFHGFAITFVDMRSTTQIMYHLSHTSACDERMPTRVHLWCQKINEAHKIEL